MTSSGARATPRSKLCLWIFPFWLTSTTSDSDRALTTDAPTP